ncbi:MULTISPECIES: hypothetical protein [unclassified Brevibacterium]|uniref:hypothetical protein n=1 Tax=Brevibacterium sp. H-BE7 TaxID=1727208 RepID=UPI001E584E27|nr:MULTISPECIES: hypothetical protein [unclassified Brevibacterium]MDK8433473.1 hypothetical protein [Brevibacterium sp. H-BE7]
MTLRYIGEPELIRAISSELVPASSVGVDNRTQIAVDRQTGLLPVLARPLPKAEN